MPALMPAPAINDNIMLSIEEVREQSKVSFNFRKREIKRMIKLTINRNELRNAISLSFSPPSLLCFLEEAKNIVASNRFIAEIVRERFPYLLKQEENNLEFVENTLNCLLNFYFKEADKLQQKYLELIEEADFIYLKKLDEVYLQKLEELDEDAKETFSFFVPFVYHCCNYFLQELVSFLEEEKRIFEIRLFELGSLKINDEQVKKGIIAATKIALIEWNKKRAFKICEAVLLKNLLNSNNNLKNNFRFKWVKTGLSNLGFYDLLPEKTCLVINSCFFVVWKTNGEEITNSFLESGRKQVWHNRLIDYWWFLVADWERLNTRVNFWKIQEILDLFSSLVVRGARELKEEKTVSSRLSNSFHFLVESTVEEERKISSRLSNYFYFLVERVKKRGESLFSLPSGFSFLTINLLPYYRMPDSQKTLNKKIISFVLVVILLFSGLVFLFIDNKNKKKKIKQPPLPIP